MTYQFEFEVDEYPDAAIPDGTMVRAKLLLVGCDVPVWENQAKTDRTEPGYEWQFHVTDPEYFGHILKRAGKKKLRWPLSEKSTHYIMATACKGKKLTAHEIEGVGSFGDLLDMLVGKYYMVRVSQSDDRKWNNLATPVTILLADDQSEEKTEQTTLAEDELPEGL